MIFLSLGTTCTKKFVAADEHGLLSLPDFCTELGNLCELIDITIRIFGKMCKKKGLPLGLIVFGLLDLSATAGRLFDSSSELTPISSSVLPPQHCLSRVVHQRGFLRKLKATLEPYATHHPMPGHLGNETGHPTPASPGWSWLVGHRIEELFAAGLLVLGRAWALQSIARCLVGDV